MHALCLAIMIHCICNLAITVVLALLIHVAAAFLDYAETIFLKYKLPHSTLFSFLGRVDYNPYGNLNERNFQAVKTMAI